MNIDSIGPTDPAVYNRSERQSTTESIYDLPRPLRPAPTTDEIREILDDLEAYERRRVATATSNQHDNATSTPHNETTDDGITTCTTGAPIATVTAGTSTILRIPIPPTTPARSERSISPLPLLSTPSTLSVNSTVINDTLMSGTHQHSARGISAPIPQGSPPVTPLQSPNPPPYYRDYLNPDAAQAYYFICHSAWYIQVNATTIYCENCATSEHVFCDRGISPVWRHLHFISRNFQHTTLHCGRCYKLLLQTRRAIDCYYCRQYVMENVQRVNHMISQLMCDVTLFP